MSDVQLYLLEVDKHKPEANRIAVDTAGRLERKEIKLLQLIEDIGEYVNSEDASIRSKTLDFLAEVLAALPPGVLSGQQRALLCEFILSRIADDIIGIGSSAKALTALESRGKWDTPAAQKVMTT